jgi:hypothetical protein
MKIADAILIICGLIALFKAGELAFWAMGQKSTLLNIGGLCLFVALGIVIYLIIIKSNNKK